MSQAATTSTASARPPPPKILIADVRKNGPIPPGFKFDGDTKRLSYASEKVPSYNSYTSRSSHPLLGGVTRLKGERTARLYMAESHDKREIVPGVSQPPITYVAMDWVWQPHNDWYAALHEGLRLTGMETPMELIQKAGVEALTPKGQALLKSEGREVLYHPSDRPRFTPAEPEAVMAQVCRVLKRNLVLFCPEGPSAFDDDWARVYEFESAGRSPIRVRWSTGQQEEYRPVILGCLPVGKNDIQWYTMQLHIKEDQDALNSHWNVPISAEMLESLSFPDPKYGNYVENEDDVCFQWAIVALHRCIALGAKIPDTQMSNWLHQYGKHLARNNRRVDDVADVKLARQFVFKPAEGIDGPKWLSFNRLSRMILGSPEDSPLRTYAMIWDNAILAMYQYQDVVRRGVFDKTNKEQIENWKERMGAIRDIYNPDLHWKNELDPDGNLSDQDEDEDDSASS